MAVKRTADLEVGIRVQDYREIQGTFDRITSVGMMEHVGPKNLAAFFEVCSERLEADGLMLHHTIGSNETKLHADPWFDNLSPLWQMVFSRSGRVDSGYTAVR